MVIDVSQLHHYEICPPCPSWTHVGGKNGTEKASKENPLNHTDIPLKPSGEPNEQSSSMTNLEGPLHHHSERESHAPQSYGW